MFLNLSNKDLVISLAIIEIFLSNHAHQYGKGEEINLKLTNILMIVKTKL